MACLGASIQVVKELAVLLRFEVKYVQVMWLTSLAGLAYIKRTE